MKKVILFILVFLSVLAIIIKFSYKPLSELLKFEQRAGLRVEASKKSKILINNKEVGETPFQDENLIEGEYLIDLQPLSDATAAATVSWQGHVKLNGGTLTVVNRELEAKQSASSGEVITLEKGSGATIISNPAGAVVSVDGQEKGRTPLSVQVSAGEHQFLLSKDNFLKRSIRATLVEGYNLVLSVDMAISEADLTKIPTVATNPLTQLVVKNTPTGFLRIRATSSTSGKEVGRVSPGDTLTLIDESSGWYKVKLQNGIEGFVSSDYVEKKQ